MLKLRPKCEAQVHPKCKVSITLWYHQDSYQFPACIVSEWIIMWNESNLNNDNIQLVGFRSKLHTYFEHIYWIADKFIHTLTIKSKLSVVFASQLLHRFSVQCSSLHNDYYDETSSSTKYTHMKHQHDRMMKPLRWGRMSRGRKDERHKPLYLLYTYIIHIYICVIGRMNYYI